MVRLEGERIVLREWRPDEADAMHRWLGHPEVTRFLGWGSRTRSDSVRHLRECVDAQLEVPRRRFFLALELRASAVVIGDAGFEWSATGSGNREGRLGYFLEPPYWGHGYATEAASQVLALAFRDLGAAAMRASCDERNGASERVMQRLGIEREPGREAPGRRAYGISREAWLSR